MSQTIRVAVLDMYDGEPNQGMRCIIDIINRFNQLVNFKIFDIRGKKEFPEIDKYDIFISSGGPGNPLEGDGNWDHKWYNLIGDLWQHNQNSENKKHILFICHSFQMACHYFGVAKITKRKSTSFGVMSIHRDGFGIDEPIYNGLENPFWAIDSRDYQVVQPHLEVFEDNGFEIISLEKIRNHVELERAIMGVRFSKEFVGVQYHPEADPISFIENLKSKEKRDKIINLKGKEAYLEMLENLIDEDKIYKTNATIIPNFLRNAINEVMKFKKVISN